MYWRIPLLFFLLPGNWGVFLIGASFSGRLIAGAFLLVGIETSKQYFDLARRMVAADDEWWNQWRSMHNLRALTIYWLPAAWQPYLWCIGVALVLAALIARNLGREKNAAGFALTWIINLLGVLIVIPHLFTHDLSLLILPCALFISLFRQRLPLVVAVGLMIVAALPAVNYAAPTSTAITLLILFMVSVAFGSSRLTRS
jgi:hypothetical protein